MRTKSRILFSVTFDIVTPESAEHGDFESSGYVVESVPLREAVKELRRTRTNLVDGVTDIATDSSPCVRPRWVTIMNGTEFETGASESRSLHIPHNVTDASARRIARLCGVKLPRAALTPAQVQVSLQ